MKKIIKNITLVIVFLFLITSTALLAYMHFNESNDKELTGTWTAKLDMKERAAVTAYGWLQDIEAVSVSLEDMEKYMQDLTIEISLTLEQTAYSEGIFQCSVLPESYDACIQSAYEAYAAAFRELLAERLRMAGYTENMDEETIETLVTETFGMSTVSYLLIGCPNLLPSLEELQTQYNGSGTYEVTEDILTRQFDTGQSITAKTEQYIRKGDRLILSEENSSADHPVMYTLKP